MRAILDISGDTPLSAEDARKLEAVAEKLRHPFVKLVDSIALQNSKDIDWWVTPIATRNTFSSQFFLDCCRARMLDDLLASPEELNIVIVGSPGMAHVAQALIKKHFRECRIQFNHGTYLRKKIFSTFRNFFGAAILSLLQWVCANILVRSMKCVTSESIILIDTFLYSNSIRDGKFHDRHFPGIESALDPSELDKIFYFPNFYGIRNFVAVLQRLKKHKLKFILKEHYLHIGDYFFALGHMLRVAPLRPSALLQIDNINVSEIANDYLGIHCSPPSAIAALLKYRAIYRMSKAELPIGRVISWFENQDINRALCIGVNRFYTGCPIIGYIGYVPSGHYHLCTLPTTNEVTAGVLPTKIAVMGGGFVQGMREFSPELDVECSPALRYQHLFSPQPHEFDVEKLVILVALPAIRREALDVIAAVRSAIPEILTSIRTPIKIVVKPHPSIGALPQNLSRLSHDSRVFVEWSQERLEMLLARTDIMISTASSACFESLTMNVPVVVMGNMNGLTYVSIPRGIPTNLWQLWYPGESLYSAIENLRNAWSTALVSNADPAVGFREMYLEPVTRAGVRKLILGKSD